MSEKHQPSDKKDLTALTAAEALLHLRNEVQGFLDVCRHQMIEAAGYTNVCVLERRVEEAKDVIDQAFHAHMSEVNLAKTLGEKKS